MRLKFGKNSKFALVCSLYIFKNVIATSMKSIYFFIYKGLGSRTYRIGPVNWPKKKKKEENQSLNESGIALFMC